MTDGAIALLAWLWSRPETIAPRRVNTAIATAIAADETDDPRYYAVLLDVFAAGETGSDDPSIAGGCPGVPIGTACKREHGARYCGVWMVQCRLVPVGASLVDEARIAIALFRESARACPTWPMGQFAGAGCAPSALVDFRVNAIVRELAFVEVR